MVKKKSEFIKLMEKGEVHDSYNKRGYFIPSLSRSRLGKKGNDKPLKPGAAAQRDFIHHIKKLFINIEGKLEGEPYANSTIDRLNKKNKKTLN